MFRKKLNEQRIRVKKALDEMVVTNIIKDYGDINVSYVSKDIYMAEVNVLPYENKDWVEIKFNPIEVEDNE